MEYRDTIAKICQMPIDFRRRRDVSMSQLLDESGYKQHRTEITETNILSYIKEHPEVIEAWHGQSEDQRCSPAWCFMDETTLGYINMSGKLVKEVKYADPVSACAAYVKKQTDMMSRRTLGLLTCLLMCLVLPFAVAFRLLRRACCPAAESSGDQASRRDTRAEK